MALVTKPNTFVDGATIYASEHNDNFDGIYNDYNGNITNANISATANIDESKIAFTGTKVVRLTGDQTIAGIKTFTSFPITPSSAPTTDYQVANKKYVDDFIKSSQVTGTTNITTGGTTYADMTDMSLTLVGEGTYIFTFNAPIYLSASGGSRVYVALDIDGTDVVEACYGGYSIATENPVGRVQTTINWIASITTETTAKIQWKHSIGTATQYGTESTRVFSYVKIN